MSFDLLHDWPFRQCRICKGEGDVRSHGQDRRAIFKYGVRHYAHAVCGFEKVPHFLHRVPIHKREQCMTILRNAGFTRQVREYRLSNPFKTN